VVFGSVGNSLQIKTSWLAVARRIRPVMVTPMLEALSVFDLMQVTTVDGNDEPT
jgi:hypothetical protein